MSQAFWISDNRHLIPRFINASGIITTPVLTSSDTIFNDNGGFEGPWGIAMSPNGNTLYVIDEVAKIVWAIDVNTSVVTRIAGGGGSLAQGYVFGDIYSVATDSLGNVYIGDPGASVILCVNTQGTLQTILGISIAAGDIAIVAGTHNTPGASGDGGPAISATLHNNYGIALDSSNNLYLCDQANNKIRKVTTAGVISTVVGTGPNGAPGGFGGDGGPALSAQLNQPLGISIDPAGNIYISDTFNDRIRVVNTQATTQTLLGTSISAGAIETVAAAPASTHKLWFCGLDTIGNLGFCNVPTSGNAFVYKLSTLGVTSPIAGNGTYGFTGDTGPATSAEIGEAFDMVFVPTPPPESSVALFKLVAGQTFDDYTPNTAINSTYATYGFVNSAKAAQNPLLGFHRKRYSEIQMYIKGSGQEQTTLFPNYILKQDGVTFNPAAQSIPPIILQTDPSDDLVRPINISGNRVFVMYSTDAVGAAFNLSKTLMIGVLDGWNTVNPNV